MNRVSDMNLAIAVSKAGCLPSIIISEYTKHWGEIFDYDKFKSEFNRFVEETNGCNIILSMTDFFIITHFNTVLEFLDIFKISHIEVIPYYTGITGNQNYTVEQYIQNIVKIKQKGPKVIVKCLNIPVEPISESLIKYGVIDAIIVKSSKGAGKAHPAHRDLNKLIREAKELYPKTHIIGCGGVATKQDIEDAISAGALAVGLGTIFAMSEESKICPENKNNLLFNKQVEKIGNVGLKQNAVVFEKHTEWDNENNSVSLEKGVLGKGGHIFIGHAIKEVHEILSVENIVKKLTS